MTNAMEALRQDVERKAELLIGHIESCRVGEALYFTFVTGLTIGCGDFTQQHFVTRFLAVAIGSAGIVLAGLVAAVAVQALRAADRNFAERDW
jgi:Ion channel